MMLYYYYHKVAFNDEKWGVHKILMSHLFWSESDLISIGGSFAFAKYKSLLNTWYKSKNKTAANCKLCTEYLLGK